MKTLIALTFALLVVFATADECPESIVEHIPDVLKDGIEIQDGNYDALIGFTSGLTDICGDCDLSCGFLSYLAQHKYIMHSLGCVNGLVNSAEGLAQAAASAGVDVFGDAQLIYGLYKTINDCNDLVSDMEEDREKHEDHESSSLGATEGGDDAQDSDKEEDEFEAYLEEEEAKDWETLTKQEVKPQFNKWYHLQEEELKEEEQNKEEETSPEEENNAEEENKPEESNEGGEENGNEGNEENGNEGNEENGNEGNEENGNEGNEENGNEGNEENGNEGNEENGNEGNEENENESEGEGGNENEGEGEGESEGEEEDDDLVQSFLAIVKKD